MKALDVANFFILTGSLNEGTEMTNARVNKLLYFAQGWHLAIYGTPLFSEDFEAWQYGPVINEIYQSFKICNSNAILETLGDFDINSLEENDIEFLTSVFCKYVDDSTSSLISKTHEKDTPWRKIYVAGKNNIISKEEIKKYFGARKSQFKTIDDKIADMPSVGYVNENGVTVLPNEYEN